MIFRGRAFVVAGVCRLVSVVYHRLGERRSATVTCVNELTIMRANVTFASQRRGRMGHPAPH